ncbi:MAG: HAD family phosphatase [Lachnospiraceae bacterium]|nr:HAD family phosphatase [Lachnospiraceae bacterium]
MDAVIFDMDGVLFDTERLYMEGWTQVAKKRGIAGMEEVARGCIGLNRSDSRSYVQTHYGEEFDYDDFRVAVTSWVKTHIKIYGLPMKPGVEQILRYLKQRGISIGLATSTSYQIVLEYLKSAGILDYFRVIVTGDMIEHSKPQPDIYLLACRKLGVEPSKAYAIEDSPNGLLAAYRAGLKAILVPDLVEPTLQMRSQSHQIFYDLTEVMVFLQKIV